MFSHVISLIIRETGYMTIAFDDYLLCESIYALIIEKKIRMTGHSFCLEGTLFILRAMGDFDPLLLTLFKICQKEI